MAPDYGCWYQNGVLFPLLTSVLVAVDRTTKENACLPVGPTSSAALAGNRTAEVLHHPVGRHAFDILDDDRSREIIRRAVEFLRTRL